jgi:hypothetical protein
VGRFATVVFGRAAMTTILHVLAVIGVFIAVPAVLALMAGAFTLLGWLVDIASRDTNEDEA